MRPVKNMHQLQSKRKAIATSHYLKDLRHGGFQQRPRRETREWNLEPRAEGVNEAFKEPMHKILEKIKHESYFRWPDKMGGHPTRRNYNLYCVYHRDKGHTTKQCRTFKDHLKQLVKARHLKEFMVGKKGGAMGQTSGSQRGAQPPPLEINEVIHATSVGVSAIRQKGMGITT